MDYTKEIQLYTASVDVLEQADAFEAGYRSVRKERQEKVDALRFKKDKNLSLGVGLLLKKALLLHGVDYENAAFSVEDMGKTVLPGSGICFNLSHSENRVLCAVSSEDVGCDIERIKETDLTIAKRFFHESEARVIAEEPDPEKRLILFYRFWTLKESYQKATGLGFSLPLNLFRIDLGDPVTVYRPGSEERYRFREYDPKDGYRYACCGKADSFSELQELPLF